MQKRAERLLAAQKAMQTEAGAIVAAAGRLEDSFLTAVDMILEHPGKVVVAGMGKSGHVARKIVATLQSTGTPAAYLHPAEAVHGDLGLCQLGDPVIMISKSGATSELVHLIAPMRDLDARLIGILGSMKSPLASEMDVVLDASVQREADPESFTPTASSMVALALGDALAVALMEARGFTAEHFRRYHPAGQLGRNLRLRVSDAMHRGGEVAWVGPEDSLKQVVIAMSSHPLGAACVVSGDHKLIGLITDGDVRRALEKHDDIRTLGAEAVMTRSPIGIAPHALLQEALRVMEDRPSQISVLPVVDPVTEECLGLIRVHDIYQGRGPSR